MTKRTLADLRGRTDEKACPCALARPSMFMVPRKLVLMVLMGCTCSRPTQHGKLAAGSSARPLLHSMDLGVLESAARPAALAGRSWLVLDGARHLVCDRQLALMALQESQSQANTALQQRLRDQACSVDVKSVAGWRASCSGKTARPRMAQACPASGEGALSVSMLRHLPILSPAASQRLLTCSGWARMGRRGGRSGPPAAECVP